MSLRALRARWRDGIKDSDLSPKARLCALLIADTWAIDDGRPLWVEMAVLVHESGLSERAAQYAMRELVDAGWLQLTEPARHHHPPGYLPGIPSRGGTRR